MMTYYKTTPESPRYRKIYNYGGRQDIAQNMRSKVPYPVQSVGARDDEPRRQ